MNMKIFPKNNHLINFSSIKTLKVWIFIDPKHVLMESAEKLRWMIQLQVGIIIDQVVLCNMLGNGSHIFTFSSWLSFCKCTYSRSHKEMGTLFPPFSPSNLGQIGYPRIVLKSTCHEDFQMTNDSISKLDFSSIISLLKIEPCLLPWISQPKLHQIKHVGGVLESSWWADFKNVLE